jgi:HAD superfamily hydrolase (TIGR01509 family)
MYADRFDFAFQGVVLDVDGTLLDSNDAHALAWCAALAQFGFRVDAARIRRLVGMGGDKLLPAVAGIDSRTPLGRDVSRKRREIFHDHWLPRVNPFPGARKLLLALRRRGQRLVVATSAERSDLDGLLERADVEDLIDACATSADAGRSKPDPDIVKVAMQRACVPEDSIVMIGDTPYDVRAGTAAGIPVIGFECGGWSAAGLRGSLRVFAGPGELATVLDLYPLADWFGGLDRPPV